MTEALLYKSSPKWRMGVAFGTAVLVHFAAVALASLHPQEQSYDISPGDYPPEVVTVTTSEDPTPPPEEVAPLPIENPINDSDIPEEAPTPSPIQPHIKKPVVAIVRPVHAPAGPSNFSSARISALSAPRPEYPYEARRQKITGSGMVALTVDSATGRVTDVVMETSTGNPVLDNAALTGFRRWRFKPGTISKVRSPITFTLLGAQY